jgi:hypothetical protein
MTAPRSKHGTCGAPLDTGPRRRRIAGRALLAAAAVALLVAWGDMSASLPEVIGRAAASRGTLWTLLLLYTVLLALPFVPGAEIGLALLVLFGAAMAWPVYLATILALSIGFAAGRLASGGRHAPMFPGWLSASDPRQRAAGGPWQGWWGTRLVRFRWIALVALINMPGNTLIGGGGGIAMAAGYSRAFSYPAFLACAAVAVAPVPGLVLLAECAGIAERLGHWLGYLV